MVFPYYPRPQDDVPEPEEEQQSEESQPPIPSYLYDVFAYTGEDLSSLYPSKPAPDPGYVAPGESHPLPSGPTTHPEPPIPNDIVAFVSPAPTFSGPNYIMPGVTLNPSSDSQPTERSDRQAPTSNAGGQGSTVIAPDIEWSPEDEPSGIIPFVQAAAAGTRDGSEDKTTAICEALYAANPEGVARGIKIMRGAELDEEEDSVQELTRILQTIAPRGLFEDEPWYTTKLGSPESLSVSAAEEESLSDQAQAPTEAGNSEAMELNRRLRYSLTESSPNEWDASLTSKEDLETHLLIPKLKRFIHGFDENAVNWDEFTLEESIDFYLRQIAGELRALSENPAVSDEYFQEIQAEYARAAELQALAKPIALDDTAAYTEVFDVGVEGERAHVQDQLEVIYEYLDITPADDHFESQSTTDLKYELYSLLVYHVIPLRGSDQDPLAAQLFRSYTQAAGVSPQDAVDRLQGTYREPDILGFLFVMGLTMLVEPLDWALTTVDVINALSEGDIESAVGNFILGIAPFASSRMDDAFRLLDDLGAARRGGPLGNMPVYFANPAGRGSPAGLHSRHVLKGRGFDDKAIDIFEYRGGTGPGSGAKTHGKWTGDRSTRGRDFNDKEHGYGIKEQNENAKILREQYMYNIVEQPDDDQLREIGYIGRTDVEGSPIFNERRPDYIIEGRAFDHYAAFAEDEEQALLNIWGTVGRKVPAQTDRLVIDLSNTSLTPERLIDELNGVDYSVNTFIDPGFEDLKEVHIMKNGKHAGTWVNPQF